MSDDFLSRWSRRKRGAESEPEEAETATTAPAAPAVETAEEEDEAELLARLGLKHPDEMCSGDDFGGFLKAAVPQHLKTLALRRLWRSNPTLACVDGLNDYDGDFTGGGVPAGSLKTSYQVGRGLLRRVAEVVETPADQEAAFASGQDEGEAPTSPGTDEQPLPEPSAAEPQREEPPGRAARRRMVFRSDGDPCGG